MKLKNVLMISFLAIAGIFGASSAIINNEVKETPVVEKAEASTNYKTTDFIYVDISGFTDWAGDNATIRAGCLWKWPSGSESWKSYSAAGSAGALQYDNVYKCYFPSYNNAVGAGAVRASSSGELWNHRFYADSDVSSGKYIKISGWDDNGNIYSTATVTVREIKSDATGTVLATRTFPIANGQAKETSAFTSKLSNYANYTFDNYYTTADGNTKSTSVNSSVTIYARYIPNSYSITYKDKGGSAFSGTHESGYPTTHTYGTATQLKGATKSGYSFGGWFTTSGCTGSPVTSLGATAYTSSPVLYAKWDEVITHGVSFAITAGQTSYGSLDKTSITGVPDGASITVSDNTVTINGTTVTATPTDSGAQYTYAFNSWTNASGTVTSDITIYANFTRSVNNYNVTIKSNNSSYGKIGTEASVVVSVPYGTTYSTSSNTLTMNAVTYTANPTDQTAQYSYAFTSWSSTSGTITGTTTITATFTRTAKSYNLTYKYVDTEGNVIATATVTSTPYYTSKTLPTPEVSGYKYKTWHDGDGTSGTARAIGYSFRMPASNTTYTAEFERVGGYVLGLDGDYSETLTVAKYMTAYGEDHYVYKNVTLTVGQTFIVYQVPTSGDNTWHGYTSVNGGDAYDDFKLADEGYDHIQCKVAGTYDIVLNDSTGKVYLYRKGSGAIDQGYYMIGTGSFASGTTPTWAFANALKMGVGTSGNTAQLESAGGTSVTAGSQFKVAYHENTSSNTWYSMTLGAQYDFASVTNGTVTITQAGNYNFYFKRENSTNYIYIVDVGAISEYGFLYFSSNATSGNIHFTSKLANGDVVVNNQTLDTITGLEVSVNIGSFDGKTYLYKFPIYNLRGNQGGALVTQVVYNDGTETTVTGIPTNATTTPHYYARDGVATTSKGDAAKAVFDIAYAIEHATDKSVCNISQSDATALLAEYNATGIDTSLLTNASINTWTTAVDGDKSNITLPMIVMELEAKSSGRAASAIHSFNPFSIMNGESGDNATTIIIIIAASVSLLSITALSILLVKKRKRVDN